MHVLQGGAKCRVGGLGDDPLGDGDRDELLPHLRRAALRRGDHMLLEAFFEAILDASRRPSKLI